MILFHFVHVCRHSRFGGTYSMPNVKAIGDNDLIYHRPLSQLNNISFDHNKTRQKRPKNRAPIKDQEVKRRSTLAIRLFLKEFCVQFLENCYNPLMSAVKVSKTFTKLTGQGVRWLTEYYRNSL